MIKKIWVDSSNHSRPFNKDPWVIHGDLLIRGAICAVREPLDLRDKELLFPKKEKHLQLTRLTPLKKGHAWVSSNFQGVPGVILHQYHNSIVMVMHTMFAFVVSLFFSP